MYTMVFILQDQFENNMFEYRQKNKEKRVNVAIPNSLYNKEGLKYFLICYFNSCLDQCPISISSILAYVCHGIGGIYVV